MGYDLALEKAWKELTGLTRELKLTLRFLADEYDIDLRQRRIFSLSCNVPAKDYISIIILHYLIQKLSSQASIEVTGQWVEFRQIFQAQGYYPAFKKRVIDLLLRKYGSNPDSLLDTIQRLPAKRVQLGDVGVAIQVFPGVPVLITVWKADDEFKAEANMLFDKSISKIFCFEDIVVLAEMVIRLL